MNAKQAGGAGKEQVVSHAGLCMDERRLEAASGLTAVPTQHDSHFIANVNFPGLLSILKQNEQIFIVILR